MRSLSTLAGADMRRTIYEFKVRPLFTKVHVGSALEAAACQCQLLPCLLQTYERRHAARHSTHLQLALSQNILAQNWKLPGLTHRFFWLCVFFSWSTLFSV